MAIDRAVSLALGGLLVATLAGGCGGSLEPSARVALATKTPPRPTPDTAAASVAPSATGSTSSPAADDRCDVGDEELPAGATCQASFIDGDAPVAPFARYTIPAGGWHPFNGAYKDVEGPDGIQRVGALFVTVANLTVDACEQQVGTEPAVGATVDDLATALADLPPFEVTAAPTDVTAFGHPAKHLEIRVPLDQASAGFETFTGCGDHLLKTWISPGHVSSAFNGYTGPGDTEAFWILDVGGQRLVISALTSANASPALVAERQALLDSIVIIP